MDELIRVLNDHTGNEISIVFGNEQSGLSNEELKFVTILYQYLLTTAIHL